MGAIAPILTFARNTNNWDIMKKIDKFKLGQITSAVGLKGEVKVYPYTDYKERFEELTWLYIENEKVNIEKVRYQGDLAIIKFAGINDRNEAEAARQKYLFIDRENARKLPKDTYYIADLLGLLVLDENGQQVGTLVDIIQNTAQDLYEVEKPARDSEKGERFLIPAVDEFIIAIDMEKRQMTVKLIEGLV